MDPEERSRIQDILASDDIALKSIEVIKPIELVCDIGNLLVSDTNELDKSKFNSEEAEYLKSLARDGTQFIINKIWELPYETKHNGIYVDLPEPTEILPREKPAPKPKPPSKWELYAKAKGIQKTRRGNKVWDEDLKKWIPRWGYLKAKAEREKNWVMEVPQNADPYEDQFEKASDEKKEKFAKNEFSRLRNIAKARNIKTPNVGVTSFNMSSQKEVKTMIDQAKVSTASLGKFQENLPKEQKKTKAKKRKFMANDNSEEGIRQDKDRAIEVFSTMKKTELNYEAAVNKQVKLDDIQESQTPKKDKTSGRRSKNHGGKRRNKWEQKALSKGLGSKQKGGKKGAKSLPGGKNKALKRHASGTGTGGKKGGKGKPSGKRRNK